MILHNIMSTKRLSIANIDRRRITVTVIASAASRRLMEITYVGGRVEINKTIKELSIQKKAWHIFNQCNIRVPFNMT